VSSAEKKVSISVRKRPKIDKNFIYGTNGSKKKTIAKDRPKNLPGVFDFIRCMV